MKKWTNKGHEFDTLGKKFKKKSSILLVGNDIACAQIREKLNFLEVPIHTCSKKKFTIYNILKKLFFYNIAKFMTIIVVDTNPYESGLLISKCEKKFSIKRNEDIFWLEDFTNYYLSIFAVYVSDKVYSPSNCFICTTVCNLNCKNCLNFKPYDKKLQHYDIESLENSVDLYFSAIDRVGLFHVSGGEPFLYPHLSRLLTYIGEKYREKIDILGTVTNSTVIPSDELCKTLEKYNVRLEIDDYTKSVPQLKKGYDKLLEKLSSYNIITQINKPITWFSLIPTIDDLSNASEEILIKKFSECNNPFMEFKKDKFHQCCYAEFAEQAGLIEQSPSDVYDVSKFNKMNKKELVEFRLGYTEKGYVEFCKFCKGFPTINPHTEIPAEQAAGNLAWNKNTPCIIG